MKFKVGDKVVLISNPIHHGIVTIIDIGTILSLRVDWNRDIDDSIDNKYPWVKESDVKHLHEYIQDERNDKLNKLGIWNSK